MNKSKVNKLTCGSTYVYRLGVSQPKRQSLMVKATNSVAQHSRFKS